MEVTVKFSHDQEQDAKDYLNAMDENRELLVKYARIEGFIDDLVTATEHNVGVLNSKSGAYVSVAGIEMPGTVVDSASLSYILVNAIVNRIETILEG